MFYGDETVKVCSMCRKFTLSVDEVEHVTKRFIFMTDPAKRDFLMR